MYRKHTGTVLWDNEEGASLQSHWQLWHCGSWSTEHWAALLSCTFPVPSSGTATTAPHPARLLSCRHKRKLPSRVSHQEKVPRNQILEKYWLKVLNQSVWERIRICQEKGLILRNKLVKLYCNCYKQARKGEVLAWVRSWEFCLKAAALFCHLCDKHML